MELRIGFIDLEDMKDKNFNCPDCKAKDPFMKVFPAMELSKTYSASKSVCQYCNTPFVGLDTSMLKKDLKKEFKEDESFVLEANLFELEDEAFAETRTYSRH